MLLQAWPLSTIYCRMVYAAAGDPPGAADPAAEIVTDPTSETPAAGDQSTTESATLLPDNNVADADVAKPDDKAQESTPPQKDWRDKELARKHAQNKSLKDKLAETEREVSEMRALIERQATRQSTEGNTSEKPAAAAAPSAPAKPDQSEIQAEAQRIIAQRDHDAACNAAYDKGVTDFGKDKFDAALQNIAAIGEIDAETMQGCLATDNPAKVLFELGSNPEKFQALMEMPIAKRMNEMVKIATASAPKKSVSNAPAPVVPLGGRGSSNTNDLRDDLSDEEWNARRERQRAAKWKERQARIGT